MTRSWSPHLACDGICTLISHQRASRQRIRRRPRAYLLRREASPRCAVPWCREGKPASELERMDGSVPLSNFLKTDSRSCDCRDGREKNCIRNLNRMNAATHSKYPDGHSCPAAESTRNAEPPRYRRIPSETITKKQSARKTSRKSVWCVALCGSR